jgi:signal transduction histidine kinase
MKPAQPVYSVISEADVLQSLSSGITVINRDNELVYCNDAFARWLDLPRELFVGHPVAELVDAVKPRFSPPESAEACFSWKPDESIVIREFTLRVGERYLHMRQDATPWRDAAGTLHGCVFAFHDVSREKSIDRMKTEFIAVASHELRTPMTSIKGSIDLVLSGFAGKIGAETQELMEIAHKSCDRLIRLINDILDLAKIEAGQVKLKKAVLDLSDPVERSIRGVKSYADQVGVKVSMTLAENLPAVEGDKDRIEQVVTNLLSNAIKFSPKNGEVRVELRSDAHWIECSVADQGCGIAEQDLEKVFGKFQQVGESPRKGGTGLGLAIAQGLVHEHGGKIWVESQVNNGSRFIFRLPAAAR